jgi:hypothetical protein
MQRSIVQYLLKSNEFHQNLTQSENHDTRVYNTIQSFIMREKEEAANEVDIGIPPGH